MKRKRVVLLCVFMMMVAGTNLGFGDTQNSERGGQTSERSSQKPPFFPPVPAPDSPAVQKAVPGIVKISPGVFEVGGCRLSKAEGWVQFDAAVNMNQGLLEYLIVSESGKLHESLLRTTVDPYALQLAFLLIGLEGTSQPLSAQGDRKTPTGDRVTVLVRVRDDTSVREVPIERWVRVKDKVLDHVPWVFTGSVIVDGVFMASVEKSIMAVYHDPVALIDHALEEGAEDEIWFANEKTVPPVGTPVEVVVKAVRAP